MTTEDPYEGENLAATLARVLPVPETVLVASAREANDVHHVALPKGFTLVTVDNEELLPGPRRAKAKATFSDAASFLTYVGHHATPSTAAWCTFDPQTFALSFQAVIDDHAPGAAGWRAHQASFIPALSTEWKAWKGQDRKSMPQITFAEWLQEHEPDIASQPGMPTSLQMLTMATEFVALEERVFKSAVKLNSGGVRLVYVADADKGTTDAMQMFEKFALGIPVFADDKVLSPITARLKYRQNGGAVSFHYELVRPDKAHQAAALDMIEQIRGGLLAVPLLMGSCA